MKIPIFTNGNMISSTSLHYSYLNIKYKILKTLIIAELNKRNVSYEILPIEKILTVKYVPKTIIILHYCGFNNTFREVQTLIKKKYSTTNIISVVANEKYHTIENKTFYLEYSPELHQTTKYLNILPGIISENNKFAIDNINCKNKFILDLKKSLNIEQLNISCLKYSICIFTELPDNYLLIQDLRLNGCKIVFIFECDKLKKSIYGIYDNITTLQEFNKIINAEKYPINLTNNFNVFIEECVATDIYKHPVDTKYSPTKKRSILINKHTFT